MYKFSHIIKIYHIFTSPAHNYFTKDRFEVGDSPTIEHESITLIAGKGLVCEKLDVAFEGIAHCAPCTWMNAVFAKGAYSLMRGRGGLRVRVIKGGKLICKESELLAQEAINADPLTPLQRPKLPISQD